MHYYITMMDTVKLI